MSSARLAHRRYRRLAKVLSQFPGVVAVLHTRQPPAAFLEFIVAYRETGYNPALHAFAAGVRDADLPELEVFVGSVGVILTFPVAILPRLLDLAVRQAACLRALDVL